VQIRYFLTFTTLVCAYPHHVSAAGSTPGADYEIWLKATDSLAETHARHVHQLFPKVVQDIIENKITQGLLMPGAQGWVEEATGRTLLHYAALYGRTSIAALLCASKALIDTTDLEGKTPLDLAQLDQASAMPLFIEEGLTFGSSRINEMKRILDAISYPWQELRKNPDTIEPNDVIKLLTKVPFLTHVKQKVD
jgi:hypothetical protein